jgi:hypothetical protein
LFLPRLPMSPLPLLLALLRLYVVLQRDVRIEVLRLDALEDGHPHPAAVRVDQDVGEEVLVVLLVRTNPCDAGRGAEGSKLATLYARRRS